MSFLLNAEEPVEIGSEEKLRALLGAREVFLAAGATLRVLGSARIGAGVSFAGECTIGAGAEIETGSLLTDVRLGPGNRVRPYSILNDVEAGAGNLFGPFCFIRDGCVVGDECILGAHVEAARSRFGSGVKASHRAFIGDAEIGARTIVGCGVVFCNWDGTGRQPTRIGDDVILGSGALLVPPLKIGDGAMIAAGSVITRDVAAGTRVIQKRERNG